MKILKQISPLVFLFHLVFIPHLCAYIDPGTGSYLVQLFIAGCIGLAYTIKVFWIQIKLFLNKLFSRKK